MAESCVNNNRLKKVLKDRGETLEGLSLELGIVKSTLYRKLKRGKMGITLQDYITIKTYLNLTPDEAKEIFGEI